MRPTLAKLMDQPSIIQAFRDASLDALDCVACDLIKERFPTDYIQMLNNNDRTDALRACLIIYVLTATVMVPHQFQLEAVLATLNGRDSIITAGTGSGKTLCSRDRGNDTRAKPFHHSNATTRICEQAIKHLLESSC